MSRPLTEDFVREKAVTVQIDEDLLLRARKYCIEQDITFKKFINSLIAEKLKNV